MKWVKEIASADQDRRRIALLSILKQENLPFIQHHDLYKDNWVNNIVVSINPSSERVVIGAHYDSIEGSTGANDNAAAVSTLIKLSKDLLSRKDISVDSVFFDREEHSGRGSERYIEITSKSNIKAMINLDICGYGDCIVIAAKKYRQNACFQRFFSEAALKRYPVYLLDGLPTGDDASFEAVNILNISIAMLPKSDIEVLIELSDVFKGKRPPTQRDQDKFMSMIVAKTMHNEEWDSVDFVQDSAMELLLEYLQYCLL